MLIISFFYASLWAFEHLHYNFLLFPLPIYGCVFLFPPERLRKQRENLTILSYAPSFSKRWTLLIRSYIKRQKMHVNRFRRCPGHYRQRYTRHSPPQRKSRKNTIVHVFQKRIQSLMVALDVSLNENQRLVEELSWWRRTAAGATPPSMFCIAVLDDDRAECL